MLKALTLMALLGLAAGVGTRLHGNPIRRVVTMLQEMQKSVEKEGETEKELYDKFMCYCETTDGELATSIDQGNTKVSELSSQLEEDTAAKAQMDQDVAQHKDDRTAAGKAIDEATAMRGKEASEFAASSGEMKANIQAMTSAVAALKKGLSASFLQTQSGAVIRNIVAHTPLLDDTQRDVLMSFLQSGDQTGEGGGTDQIVGIVETMLEEMQGDLKESTDSEAAAVATYNELMKAKNDESSFATKAIETKMARSGELAVAMATGGADLESSKDALAEDTNMKASLAKTCADKTKEFVERRSNNAEEVTALSETIKILNDDDALDLFKKTMPSAPAAAAFLQISVVSKHQTRRLQNVLTKLHEKDAAHKAQYGLMLLQLSAKSSNKVTDFAHIVKMIEDMIALLKKEQADDDKQKEFCDSELNNAGQEKANTEDNIKSVDAKMAEISEVVETTEGEITALKQGIEDLDRAVAEATEMRKQQHAEYTSTAAANQAAIELLEMARNRMNKFYNPSMYKAPAPTDAPVYGLAQEGPVSFVQVMAHTSRKQESGGVIQLLSTMIGDVEKDMTAAKMEESNSQTEYEETMSEAATKRATDSKLMVSKDSFKAELNSKLDDAKSDMSDAETMLSGLVTKIADLHSTCDFLLDNYDARREARTSEIDGLHEGAAVLGSAGFLQRF